MPERASIEASTLTRTRLVARSRRYLATFGDDRLAAEAKRENEAAFEVIYDRHHRGLLSFCRHMLGSREDAEDALQQTFASAFRALPATEQPVQLKPWLYTIARNRCLTMLRGQREHPVEEVPSPSSTGGLSEEVERRAELRELLADLDHLVERQKTALVLSEVGALDHAQVAQVLGCETNQVKSLVFQARSTLIKNRRAREIPCPEIREQLATATAGELRRGPLRRHLRQCAGCSDFREQVRRQRGMLALVLPVVPTVGLKESALAAAGIGGGGAAGGGGLIAALGASGAAKVAAVGVAVGGAAGGFVAADPDLVPRAQAAAERAVGGVGGAVFGAPGDSRREGVNAEKMAGAFDWDAAQRAARGRSRREASIAGEASARGERPPATGREQSRGAGRSEEGSPGRAVGRGSDGRGPAGRGRAGDDRGSNGRGRGRPANPGGGERRTSRGGRAARTGPRPNPSRTAREGGGRLAKSPAGGADGRDRPLPEQPRGLAKRGPGDGPGRATRD